MPICPKCHKLIAKNYAKHLRRCGATHKQGKQPLTSGDNFFMRV